MKRWIRWQGFVAFLCVTISIFLIWVLVVDPIVKRVIENSGTKIVGAKVELEKADLSIFPIGLTLFGLQVTDPDEPMKNAVEIVRIAGTIDSLQLLRRKVIINEMSVDGVRFGTQRIRSGAISKKTEKDGKDKKKDSIPGLPVMDKKYCGTPRKGKDRRIPEADRSAERSKRVEEHREYRRNIRFCRRSADSV